MSLAWPSHKINHMCALLARFPDATAAQIGAMMIPPKSGMAIIGKCRRMEIPLKRKTGPQNLKELPIPPKPSLARPAPPMEADKGPLCRAVGCRNTKQTGRDFCAEHLPLPARTRAGTAEGMRQGVSSLGDF